MTDTSTNIADDFWNFLSIYDITITNLINKFIESATEVHVMIIIIDSSYKTPFSNMS